MKLEAFLISVLSLLGLFSQSEGAKLWSGEGQVTAIQGESTTLVWTVNLTDSDVNKAWTYVKILHAEGANTEELVTFKKTGEKTIDNPSYNSRLSDMSFNVSQSGSVVTIRFTMANLVRSTDMKSYKAVLGFSSDASTYPRLTTLTVLVKPHSTEFKIKPEKNTFCLEDKVNITCKADGFPPAQVSLFLDNQLLQRKNTSVTLILSLNVKGENNFICVTNNTAGIGQTRNVKLIVKEPPKIVRCTINDEEVTSKSVIEDTKVTMSCLVTGSEPLNITWNKENVQTSLSQSNTLTFGSIHRRDSGQYRLTAYNGRECDTKVKKIFNVTVMYMDEPIVQRKRYRVVSKNSPKAQFTVTVDSNSHPSLVCHKKNTQNHSTKDISIDSQMVGSNSTFVINIIATEDGEYFCIVRSSAKTRTITGLRVYIQIPPAAIDGTFTLTNTSWKDDLKFASSYSYKYLENKVVDALKKVYQEGMFVSDVRVLRFLKGSVVVNFQVEVIANVTDPIILLKNTVKTHGGKLDELVVDPNSIKTGNSEIKEDGESTADSSSQSDDKTWTYVGVGIGVAIFILLLILVIKCILRRAQGPQNSNDERTEPEVVYQHENKGIEIDDLKMAYDKKTGNCMLSAGHVTGTPAALKECADIFGSMSTSSQGQLQDQKQQAIAYGAEWDCDDDTDSS